MKLSALPTIKAQEDRPAVIPIVQPSGAPETASDGSRVTVTVVGTYSTTFLDRGDAWRAEQETAPRDLTPAERAIETASWAVVDWHGVEAEDGTPIPCTPENVRTVLRAMTDAKLPYLLDQITFAMNNRARFFVDASTGS